MRVTLNASGSWTQTEKFLKGLLKDDLFDSLSKYGEEGVRVLAAATPRETGETAQSWSYKVVKGRNFYKIVWHNDHMAGNTPLVILMHYGHGTRNGGYVEGKDFINPAMKPVMDKMVNDGWRVVKSK